MDIRIDASKLGLIAEEKFILKSLELGYDIFKPIASYSKCDLILMIDTNLYKIQVKSTYSNVKNKPNNYHISTNTNNGGYDEKDVDFFACYIQPLDCWYIIPYSYVQNNQAINININNKDLDIYKNNFNIFNLNINVKSRYDKYSNIKKLVANDYDNDMTLTDLSIKYNISVRTVRDYIKLSNRYKNKKKIATKEEIVELYINQKLTMNEVAKKLNLTLWTTRKLFKKYNIKIRR